MSCLSVIFLDARYLLYGLLFFMIKMPLLQLIMHEYVSHETIRPRNKWLDLFLLMILYANAASVQNRKAYHITHHVHYLDPEKDPTQQKMAAAGTLWKYLLNLGRPVEQNLLKVRSHLIESNPWVQKLDAHALTITWAYRSVLFVLLPIEWFVVGILYFAWFNIMAFSLHDWFFHRSNRPQDSSLWLPFWSNQSWHLYHHQHPDRLYFGPKLAQWLNPAYYYYLVFFKASKTS